MGGREDVLFEIEGIMNGLLDRTPPPPPPLNSRSHVEALWTCTRTNIRYLRAHAPVDVQRGTCPEKKQKQAGPQMCACMHTYSACTPVAARASSFWHLQLVAIHHCQDRFLHLSAFVRYLSTEAFVKKLSCLDTSSLVGAEKVRLCREVPPRSAPNSILMTTEERDHGKTYKYYATTHFHNWHMKRNSEANTLFCCAHSSWVTEIEVNCAVSLLYLWNEEWWNKTSQVEVDIRGLCSKGPLMQLSVSESVVGRSEGMVPSVRWGKSPSGAACGEHQQLRPRQKRQGGE